MIPPRKHLQALGIGVAGASVFTAALLGAAPAVESASSYLLPYPGGTSHYVTQGGGTGGHVGTQQYAIDWGMPIGTTIVAARGGTVKYVKENSNVCGCSSSYGNSANYVVIDHGDKTQALYLHLQYNGALVSVGQKVQQGQTIARSGMTGWTCGSGAGGCGPHLHFQVEKPGIWFTQSLWVAFADVLTNGGVVRTGRTYTSGNDFDAAATATPTATATATRTPTVTSTATPIATFTATPTATSTARTAPTSGSSGSSSSPPPASHSGGGGGRSSSSPSTPTPVVPTSPTSTEKTLDASIGGTLTVSGVQAELPAGLIAESGEISVSLDLVNLAPATPAAGTSARNSHAGAAYGLASVAPGEPLRSPDGTVYGSRAFRLTVENAAGAGIETLAKPVQLRVPYSERDLELAGGQPGGIRLFSWDADAANWVSVATTADSATRTVTGVTQRTGLFTLVASVPAPSLHGPRGNEMLVSLTTTLAWQNPPGARWYHVQLLPFNNDGPGLDMIVGDPAAVQAGRLEIPPPKLGVGNYLMLPGMTYAWRVRTSPAPGPLSATDTAWSAWVSGGFRTAAPYSGSISLVSPASGATSATRTPVLEWRNSNDQIFYYEVQLSTDPEFITDPNWARAPVSWELVHGGMTSPLNSYAVSAQYALQPNTVYYWRVRPRVQGDGAGGAWSNTSSFRTPDA